MITQNVNHMAVGTIDVLQLQRFDVESTVHAEIILSPRSNGQECLFRKSIKTCHGLKMLTSKQCIKDKTVQKNNDRETREC